MTQQPEKTVSEGILHGGPLLLLHLVCFLLVVVYVNMFQLWAWLSRLLGPGLLTSFLPILVTLAVIAVISLRFVQRVNNGYRVKMLFLGLGIVGAIFSLAIPDPHVPIKRIHVAEYIVLSFFVRYTLSHRLNGTSLTVFTILLTILLGIHDEMLQGLHSLRYYGWRDIIVNSCAGLSGSLLGHGLMSFEGKGGKNPNSRRNQLTPGVIALYSMLFGAVVLQVILLYKQRGMHISYISLLPLSGICLGISLVYPALILNSRKNHGLQAVFWLAAGLLIYPLAANLAGIEFI